MYSLYSVCTQQVSTQAVNGFIKILILKGKNTGEIYKVICIIISDSVTIASSSTLEVSTGPGRMRAGPGLTWAGRSGPNDFIIC